MTYQQARIKHGINKLFRLVAIILILQIALLVGQISLNEKNDGERYRSEFDVGFEDENVSKIRMKRRVKRGDNEKTKLGKEDFYGEEYDHYNEAHVNKNENHEKPESNDFVREQDKMPEESGSDLESDDYVKRNLRTSEESGSVEE